MRNGSTKGFTLIELLIVIAIIGILAAVLIPNLLNARARAFDSGAQTCLRELGTQIEVVASNSPFEYDTNQADWDYDPNADGSGGVTIDGTAVSACEDVVVTETVAADTFEFVGTHSRGTTTYEIANGTGVTPQ